MRKRLSCPKELGSSCDFLEIRPPEAGEIEKSVDFVRAAFPHMEIPGFLWKNKLRSDKTILLSENGTRLIGIANVGKKGSNIASLDLIAVDEDYRGKGIGSILLDAVEDMAIDRGKRFVHLMTEQVKPRNVSFYSKHGYKVTGFDPNGYRHSPSVHFEKEIT